MKIDEKNLAYSWELPYYLDENGFLIVSPGDPQRYAYGDAAGWRLIDTNVDIQMAILTEWLDAGWCAAEVRYTDTPPPTEINIYQSVSEDEVVDTESFVEM